MRKVLCIVLMAFASLLSAAEGVGPSLQLLAQRAQGAYEAGRYGEALQLYATYATSGGEGAEVHYDMGNCALRSGDLGRAILEYRRALRHSPGMEAARHNLEVARRLIPARKNPWQPPPWEAFLNAIRRIYVEWAILAFAVLANLCLSVALFLPEGGARRLLVGFVTIFLTGAALGGALLYHSLFILPGRRPAVVLREAPIHAKPGGEGIPMDRLPPGSEVMQVAQAGQWTLLLWGDGRGWTPSDSVEVP